MTNHPPDEDLMLVYYNEPSLGPDVRSHVAQCEVCQSQLQALRRVLDACDDYEAPARAGNYEMAVWAKLREQIVPVPRARRWWQWPPAIAAVLAIVFAAGMCVEKLRRKPAPSSGVVATSTSPQSRERILLVALSDHLDRSQFVLAELVNARPLRNTDISGEQQRAEDLVPENRLLRQTALNRGDTANANLLADLERLLLDVAHSPAHISSPELRQIQERIEDQGLLFKVRIIETNLRKKENTL
jgi:hypothetical protein